MKQVVYDKSGRVRVKDVPVPAIADHEILVKNTYSVMSAGTEKSMIELMKKPLWKMALERPDLTSQVLGFARSQGVKKTVDLVKSRIDLWHLLGYSSSGTVVKVGKSVQGFSVGDRVACIGSGVANHAEYIAVPKTLAAKVPKGVSDRDAAFTGVACIALQSVRQLAPQIGESIAVIGLGLLGQVVCQILSANGCRVIGIDIDKTRTERPYIDAAVTSDTVRAVNALTGGTGADGVIIAAASRDELVNDAFDMSRKKGRVVLLGVCGMNIDRQKMFEKELTLQISTAFGAGSFDFAYDSMGREYPLHYVRWTSERNMQAILDLMQRKKYIPEDAKVYPITDAEKAYRDKAPVTVFSYSPKDDRQTLPVNISYKPHGRVNVGIIGAGQFIRGFIYPAIRKEKSLSVYAVATKSGTNAKMLSELYRARYASTSYEDLLNDPHINLVIIGTRHDSHARIATEALKKGKHVFSEKPMAIKEAEFLELCRVIEKSDRIYTCGFNRRYSPVVRMLKSKLSKDGPIMASYVFNNTKLAADHWVNDPDVGGGRIIGEACHVIDLFNFLTGRTAVLIQGYALATANKESNDSNNVAASIKYADGSVCNLLYSCIGSGSSLREKCTVIQDGRVFEMEGFHTLRENGKKVYRGPLDEGYRFEISELAKAVSGKENALATAKECVHATRLTFELVKKTK